MIRLFPREETFLPQFARGAEVIVEAARVLDALAAGPVLDDERAAAIKRLEHQGDQIAHETFDLLNRTWITPIDREDIHVLVRNLDDVLEVRRERLGAVRDWIASAKQRATLLPACRNRSARHWRSPRSTNKSPPTHPSKGMDTPGSSADPEPPDNVNSNGTATSVASAVKALLATQAAPCCRHCWTRMARGWFERGLGMGKRLGRDTLHHFYH